MVKLSVAIVSYNSQALTKACLESVFRFLPAPAEVVVVDNASHDGTVGMIKTTFPRVHLIQTHSNLGFAGANNLAIQQTNSQYILLLNSDTTVTTDIFTPLIKFMDSHQKVGIASPALKNQDGSTQPHGGNLPNLINILAWMWFVDDLPLLKSILPTYHQTNPSFYSQTQPVGWVGGTAMMLRRSMLDRVGYLDEQIFMYAEDIDICYRAKQAGWSTYLFSDTSLIHFNHGSGSTRQAILGEYKGLIYYFKKHQPGWQLPWLKLLLKSGALLRMIIFGKIMGKDPIYETYQQAYRLA